MTKELHIVCAVTYDADDRILISRRKKDAHLSLKWEFPGGKVERDESDEQALQRELREELAVDVALDHLLHQTRFTYPDRTVNLRFYRCRLVGERRPRAVDVLSYRWVQPSTLKTYEFPPANDRLIEMLSESEP